MGACVLIALLATATLVGSHTHEWMDDTTEKDDTIQFEHLVVEVNQSVDLQLPFDTLPVLLNNYRKQNKVYTNLQMNPNCTRDLLTILISIAKMRRDPQNYLWLLSMIDSFGKIPAGILQGDIYWTGNFDECIGVREPNERFSGKYCTLSWSMSSKKSVYQLALLNTAICVPNSCSAYDISHQALFLYRILVKIPFFRRFTKLVPILKNVKCIETPEFDANAISCLAVFLIFTLLAIIGTFSEFVLKRFNVVNGYKTLVSEHQRPVRDDNGNENDGSSVIISTDEEIIIMRDIDSRHLENSSKCLDLLTCFSLSSNSRKLFSTMCNNNELKFIHGIKFLSMVWIIIGHTYLFGIFIYGNLLKAIKDIDNLPFFTILNATFAVDTFFVLSGFLLSYLFFAQSRIPSLHGWIKFYLHRYIRLTPIYAWILWFGTAVAHHCGSGPFWDYGDTDVSERTHCLKSWWKNLLYINNFYSIEDNCMMWTWFLANEMQFFIISPIFLCFLWYLPIFGVTLTVVSIMASCLATGLISYENGLSVLFGIQAKFNLEHLDINEDKDKALDYLNKIYTKPWCRISSYLVGLLAGFLYYKYCRNPLRVKKYIIIIGSILATLLGLVVIYSTYHSTPTFLESALYNGLSRLAWALFIIWLIFMCMTRNCALVNNLLSCSFWFPLSRLTYCAYLIHPIVINAYYRNYKAPLMFSHRTIMAVVASALVYVYLTSFLLSILIEVPFRELEKKIFPQHKAAEDNESKVD